jgi:hypothetical protein
MPPEFIAIIAFDTVQLVGLIILGWMLRDVSVMMAEVPISTVIHILCGRRMDDVLRELQEKCA